MAHKRLPSLLVASTGARRRKSDHAGLPVTNAGIVAEARACFAAGAKAVHAHVRASDQAHSLDVGLYRGLMADGSVASGNVARVQELVAALSAAGLRHGGERAKA